MTAQMFDQPIGTWKSFNLAQAIRIIVKKTFKKIPQNKQINKLLDEQIKS